MTDFVASAKPEVETGSVRSFMRVSLAASMIQACFRRVAGNEGIPSTDSSTHFKATGWHKLCFEDNIPEIKLEPPFSDFLKDNLQSPRLKWSTTFSPQEG